jgi:hypothetical protein
MIDTDHSGELSTLEMRSLIMGLSQSMKYIIIHVSFKSDEIINAFSIFFLSLFILKDRMTD